MRRSFMGHLEDGYTRKSQMGPLRFNALSLFVCAALCAAPVLAAPPVDVSGQVRLRAEHVDDRQVSEDGQLLSLSANLKGVWEPAPRWSFALSGEAVGALAGRFDDGEGLPQDRGVIPDPSLLSLDEAFAEYRPFAGARVRAGRQRIVYDDERFIGAIAFRQNAQSFDAVSAKASVIGGLSIDLVSVFGVDRPLGPRGQPRRLESESLLLRAEVPFPFGSLVGYRYHLDLGDDADPSPVQGGRSLTYGAAVSGRIGTEPLSIGYLAELAQQENDETLETVPFGRARISASASFWDVDVSYERLGAGTQAFQTPLGTNHAFQGHADLFLTTPEDGLADLSIGGRLRLGDAGPFQRLQLSARAHQFDSTSDGERYGRELDVTLSARWRRFALSAERADYQADGFAEDVTRWWLTAQTSF
ncbi:MAG: alginate export family protein [Pseudomonadota bacterium]